MWFVSDNNGIVFDNGDLIKKCFFFFFTSCFFHLSSADLCVRGACTCLSSNYLFLSAKYAWARYALKLVTWQMLQCVCPGSWWSLKKERMRGKSLMLSVLRRMDFEGVLVDWWWWTIRMITAWASVRCSLSLSCQISLFRNSMKSRVTLSYAYVMELNLRVDLLYLVEFEEN